jgi:hypothetical protein
MFLANKLNKGAGPAGAYQISRSLRFNSADSAYLNRTPASAGNKQTWTLSVWVKRAGLSAFMPIYSAGPVSPRAWVLLNSSDKLDFRSVDSTNTEVIRLTTTQVFRDPSAWYHIVVAQDTTQATSSNRVKIYVNGTQITAFDTATYPTQNISNLAINDALEQNYGRYVNSPSDGYLSAYLTDTNFIDGQALTPSSFGETNAQTGVWQPKAYSGSYGTNGFYLNFSDNSNTTAATLGKDYSGNGNNWTPNNFSVTAGAGNDSLVDVPTPYGVDTGVGGTVRGNYATLNPLNAGNSAYLNNGNLDLTNPSEGAWRSGVSTIAMSTGKWYAEVTVTNNNLLIGIDKASVVFTGTTTFVGGSPTGWGVLYTGQTYNNSGVVYNNSGYAAGDIIGMTFDADTGVLTWYKNNVAMVQTITGLTSGPYVFGFSANSAGNGSINFGQRPFAYTAPSGFKALCTQNLPTPTIGATTATQASQYFAPVLYTGNGSTQSVTVGFQPDWVWLKNRGSAGDNGLYDVLRGTTNRLVSNSTNAADTISGVTAFNSSGFLLGADYNASANTFVAWNWKANGSGSTNTSGTITSTVSANTTSGFSVVTYSGNGSNSTVGHGLGVAPKFIILKQRNQVDNWLVYSEAIGAANFLRLNTDGASTSGSPWQSTSPTSSVVYLGSGSTSQSGTDYVMYCFASIAGYSAFGSYTANGSTDGPFIYTGFRPAWILFKGAMAGSNWFLFDSKRSTYNIVNNLLYPNAPNAENTAAGYVDLTSNGFKIRTASGDMNSFGTYTYACFAENPFKYSLAR